MTNDSQPTPDSSDLSGVVDQFESAWQNRKLDDIYRQLAAGGRSNAMLEMAMIDLEYRWRYAGQDFVTTDIRLPPRPCVEDYLESFDVLGAASDVPFELIVNEYRVRHRFGDAPTFDQYTSRFPNTDAFMSELRRFDADLRKLCVRMPELGNGSEAESATRRVPYEFLIGRQSVGQPNPVCLYPSSRRYKLIVTPLGNTAVSREQLMIKYGGGTNLGIYNISAETMVTIGGRQLVPSEKTNVPLPVNIQFAEIQFQINNVEDW